jgi:hypothetical protein
VRPFLSLLRASSHGLRRHEVLIQVRGAKQGSSLVTDNADQRRANLVDKIAIHERSRVFYMPGFDPPPADADLAVERVSLHLPSTLSPDERCRFCRPELVDAEEELRYSSMCDAFAELLRQLLIRTFLHRFKAREATGVRMKTRARDTLAGVSRRVDASASAYRRHRHAYKILHGPEPQGWERTHRHLSATDIRGLSEKAVSDHELEDRYRAKRLAEALATVIRTSKAATDGIAMDIDDERPDSSPSGAQVDESDVEDSEDESAEDPVDAEAEEAELVAEVAEACRLAGEDGLGEGRRKLSWVWLVGLQFEDFEDTKLLDGELTPPCLTPDD